MRRLIDLLSRRDSYLIFHEAYQAKKDSFENNSFRRLIRLVNQAI